MGDKYQNKIKDQKRKKEQELASIPIPPSAAIRNTLGEYANEDNYRLVFKFYNHRECELNQVENFKPIIDKFNYMTTNNFKFFRSRGRIVDSGDYHNLFANIPPDADLEEIEHSQEGRIIFFRIQSFICIVTVLANHRRIN